jgi:hypothetical protein
MTERDQQGTTDDPEVPEEDSREQHTDVLPDEADDADEELAATDRADEADPADVAEQARRVNLDEDEYR